MEYRYFELEHRHYRAKSDALWDMDIWNDATRLWSPYRGDGAKVLAFGTETQHQASRSGVVPPDVDEQTPLAQ